MRINTNIAVLMALEANANINRQLNSSLEKLSTGLRINKAADDASGLAIADKLRTQASSIRQGIDNGNSAVALLQIADKSMAEQSQILDTIKAKLIQANTDTTSQDGRDAIGKDIRKLLEQLNNIARQTNYNGRQLISQNDGTPITSINIGLGVSEEHTFQIGENAMDTITVDAINSNTSGLDLGTLYSKAGDSTFLRIFAENQQVEVDEAISALNGFRSDVGSSQNQIESAVRNLMTQYTNIQAAESIIRDVDYARESANFNRLSIIAQAGIFAIAQANSLQEKVLRLLLDSG